MSDEEGLVRGSKVLAVPPGSIIVVPEMLVPEYEELHEMAVEWGGAIMRACGHNQFVILWGDVSIIDHDRLVEALEAEAYRHDSEVLTPREAADVLTGFLRSLGD